VYYNYDNDSDADANNEPKYNNNSNASDDPRSNNNVLFNSKDDVSVDSATNKDIDKYGYLDSGYNSDRTDVTIIVDIDKYYTTKLNKCREPLH
jgi:hypothetical protein